MCLVVCGEFKTEEAAGPCQLLLLCHALRWRPLLNTSTNSTPKLPLHHHHSARPRGNLETLSSSKHQ